MVQDCMNCGAPIDTEHTKCPYCGTPYNYDGFNAKFESQNTCGIFSMDGGYRDENGILHRNLATTKRKFTLIEV